MSGLVPRAIPTPAGITMLHRDLRREVYWLRDALALAARGVSDQAAGTPECADLAQAVDALERIQFYSRAVQVFALMVVEAALHTYGLLRLDAKTFEHEAAYKNPRVKTRLLLEVACEVNRQARAAAGIDVASEPDPMTDTRKRIVRIVSRLASRRNALVHPAAELSAPDNTGTFRRQTPWRSGRVDLQAARAAIADMERFIQGFRELLQHYDPEAAAIFGPS